MPLTKTIITDDVTGKYNSVKVRINGFTKVQNLFLARLDINIYEKMFIIILKKYRMNKTRCWPSIKTIAKEAGFSETTAKKTKKSLEAKGMITVIKDTKYKSNVYEIIKTL